MLFEDSYQTILHPAEGIFRDRGSKFIAFAYPVKNESEVKTCLQDIRKEHSQAAHHCYAYRLTPDPTVFRVNDDHEPSGTAGKPILNAILSKQLSDTLVIVVRYFGGTLLGVPGLINAYRSAADDALSNAEITERFITEKYRLECPWPLLNEAYLLLRQSQAKILSQETNENCVIVFEIRRGIVKDFESRFQLHHPLNQLAKLEHT